MNSAQTRCLLTALLTLAAVSWTPASERGGADAGADSVPVDTLMVTGDPAPDGNGNLYQPEFAPTINNKVEVAVVLRLSDTAHPNVDDFGVDISLPLTARTHSPKALPRRSISMGHPLPPLPRRPILSGSPNRQGAGKH